MKIQKKYLLKVIESAQRMKGLIRSLLDFSRLSHGNFYFEETDLNTLARLVLTDYELMIMQKGALIEIDQLPTIEAIPLQMNQLFFFLFQLKFNSFFLVYVTEKSNKGGFSILLGSRNGYRNIKFFPFFI